MRFTYAESMVAPALYPALAQAAQVIADVQSVNGRLRSAGVVLNLSLPPVHDGKLADVDEE